jgi:acetoin utilization deacetylase AcuC-like enzyme
MNRVAFASSPRFVEHLTGEHHPERPDRIRAVYTALHRAKLIQWNPFADFPLALGRLEKPEGSLLELQFEPAEEHWLTTVHSRAYVERVKRLCDAGGGALDTSDTILSASSYDIARLAVGGILRCCDAMMKGECRRAFAAVRPPGHHAEPTRGLGFCVFSNIAIAARYLQQVYGLERIAVVDFDVHHANGTQACMEDDPSVYVVSIHQHPRTCYPGSGYDWEIGTGRGRGYTLNIPLEPGADDADWVRAMDLRVIPELAEYHPQALLLSAGFDAHLEDPMADMRLSEEGFDLMTRSLVSLAEQQCAGRVLSVLEGGYNLRALGRCVVRHVRAMMSP